MILHMEIDSLYNFHSAPPDTAGIGQSSLPKHHLQNKVEIVNGPIEKVIQRLNQKGFKNLYIDGGKYIQSFLQKDMVDELIISQLPILIGGQDISILGNWSSISCLNILKHKFY